VSADVSNRVFLYLNTSLYPVSVHLSCCQNLRLTVLSFLCVPFIELDCSYCCFSIFVDGVKLIVT